MPSETVLVTGASSGIGEELARLFAADGSDLVLVARREDRLRRLAVELERDYGVTARVERVDLGEPEQLVDLCERLADQQVEVNVLVNNAGFGARGRVAELGLGRQLEMIRLNVEALTALTRFLLPGMLTRSSGGVLNVASTAAFQPGPFMAVYYATKAYVLSFSEALVEEVRGTGVAVTALAPGPTLTGFQKEADLEETLLFKLGPMTAAQVARAGHRGFRKERTLVVPGLRNRLLALSNRVSPRWLVRRVVRKLQG
ncbi:MAG: SDR family NAD(P)-dependent oxidoreductase [Thermoanaerobaculia bacterium]